MNANEMHEIELIESYVAGRLGQTESHAFESRLSDDPGFAALFRQHKYVLDGFDGMRILSLEDTLRSAGDSDTSGKSEKAFFGRKYLILVAIIVVFGLVASAIFLIWQDGQRLELRDLAYANYEIPLALTARNLAGTQPAEFQEAMTAYARRDWKTAIQHFETVSDSMYVHDARYYQAHCAFNLNAWEDAIAGFTYSGDHVRYQVQSEWFLGLCYLGMENQTEAQRIFSAIAVKEGHFYQKRALALLEIIDRK